MIPNRSNVRWTALSKTCLKVEAAGRTSRILIGPVYQPPLEFHSVPVLLCISKTLDRQSSKWRVRFYRPCFGSMALDCFVATDAKNVFRLANTSSPGRPWSLLYEVTSGHATSCHPRPLITRWILPSSGLLRGVRWFKTDVSGLQRSHLQRPKSWTLEMGPIDSAETSILNQLTPRNGTENGRIQFNRAKAYDHDHTLSFHRCW